MKKAKFVIEIEYENADEGLAERNINVLKYEAEGDYKGLTLALTAGLGFAAVKGEDDVDTFKEKLRIMRANASAITSIYGTLKHMGLLPKGSASDDETQEILGAALKRMIDNISVGIANALNMTREQVMRANQEYKDIHNDNSEQDGKDEQGQTGTDGVDFDNYL